MKEFKKEFLELLYPLVGEESEEGVFIFNVLEGVEMLHRGQVRKFTDEPFVNHPIRMAITYLKSISGSPHPYVNIPLLAAILLHDAIEDTHLTFNQLHSNLFSLAKNGAAASGKDYFYRQRATHITKIVAEVTDIYTPEDFSFLSRKERKELENKRAINFSSWARRIKLLDIEDNTNFGDFEQMDFRQRSFAATYIPEKINQLNCISDNIYTIGKEDRELLHRLSDKLEKQNHEISKYGYLELRKTLHNESNS
jgi:hypothetical protein